MNERIKSFYKKLTHFGLASVLAFSGVAVALPFSANALPSTGSFNVSGDTSVGENMEGWLFNRDLNNDTPIAFNTDEASTGTGSLYVEPLSDSDAARKFIAEYFISSEITDINSISYDYKIGSGGDASDANEFYMNVYANYEGTSPNKYYDCKYDVIPSLDATGSFQTVMFDPDQDYQVTRGTQDWNQTTQESCPDSPSEMGEGAFIRMFALNLGDTTLNDAELDGYFDNVVIDSTAGITAYDFEPTTPTVTAITQQYQPKSGGRIKVVLNFSEPIDPESLPQGWYGSGTEFSKVFFSTKEINLSFNGLNNNSGEYTFTVDKTGPEVVSETQTYQTAQDGRIKVVLNFSEPIDPESLPQGWYGSGTEFSKVFYSLKSHNVEFTDLTGNPGSYALTIDDVEKPVVTFEDVIVSSAKQLSLNLSASDKFSGLDIVAANIYNESNTGDALISLGSGNPTRLNDPHSGLPEGTKSFSTSLTGIDVSGLPTGTYTIRAFARDHAGNEHRFATTQFEVDNTAPEVTIEEIDESNPGDEVTLSGTVDDVDAELTVTVDGTDYTVNSDSNGDWTLNITAPTAGDYTVEVVATDEAGNTGDTAETQMVVVAPEEEDDDITPQEAGPVLPITPLGGQTGGDEGILGDQDDQTANTEDDENTSSEDENGASDENGEVAGAVDEDEDGNMTLFGLAWYWWLLVLAGVAGAWYLLGAWRNRSEQ